MIKPLIDKPVSPDLGDAINVDNQACDHSAHALV